VKLSASKIPWSLRILQPLDFPYKLGVCERLYATRLSKAGVCWVKTAAGISWKLDLRNATHRWIVYGKYEGAPFLDWAKTSLPRDGIVVDSGANIGQMLLYLAQWVPNGRVLAVEPGRHQADWLKECLTANPTLQVELVRVGLGAVPQQARLKETGAPDRHGSWNQVDETEGEPIEIVRLTDLLRERGIFRIDLWKLDVEGYEIPALHGADDWLQEQRIRAVYAELDGDNGRSIVRYLAEWGYGLHLFDSRGRLRESTEMDREHTYGLFLPSK
jgi:FkbM family methyltransferase